MTNNYFLNYCQESVLHAPQRENIRNCYLSVTMNLKEEKAKEREREKELWRKSGMSIILHQLSLVLQQSN